MKRTFRIWIAVAALAAGAFAQGSGDDPPAPALPSPAGDASPEPEPDPAASPTTAAQRTQLNLLGEVDSEGGEGRRNENVQLTLINNNVLKELNTRMGTTATVVETFDVERNYFGREFGGSPTTPLHVSGSSASGLHGQVFWSHNNSALSARSFFQAGEVQPARTNDYGFVVTAPFGDKTALTVDASQRRLRGQVNGNVLVPAADERQPTVTDPATRAIVDAILGAFGSELPNRTDINPRALNTNSPQNIDNDRAAITLRPPTSDRVRSLDGPLQRDACRDVEAFQLVGGQNPDTTTKNHHGPADLEPYCGTPTTTTDFSDWLRPHRFAAGAGRDLARTVLPVRPALAVDRPRRGIPPDRPRSESLQVRGAAAVAFSGKHDLASRGSTFLRRQINGSEGARPPRAPFPSVVISAARLRTTCWPGRPSQYRAARSAILESRLPQLGSAVLRGRRLEREFAADLKPRSPLRAGHAP